MKFGPIPPREAVGGLLAHAHRVASASFKKGRRITLHDAQALEAAGVEQVVVARLETGDVEENEAAETIGRALCGNGLRMGAPYVGRANLYAEDRGLFQIDRLEVFPPERRFGSDHGGLRTARHAGRAQAARGHDKSDTAGGNGR